MNAPSNSKALNADPETINRLARDADALVKRLDSAQLDDDIALLLVDLKPSLDKVFGRQSPPGGPK